MSSSRVSLPARRHFSCPVTLWTRAHWTRSPPGPEPGNYLTANATIPGLATCCRNYKKVPHWSRGTLSHKHARLKFSPVNCTNRNISQLSTDLSTPV